VEIATFHAAKGLEWPVVHLAGVERGLVPIGHADDDPDALAEERRLFYVALTRAEHQLHLTWAATRTFGERTVARARSPYLDEVEAACRTLGQGGEPADWPTHLSAQRARLQRGDAAGGRGRAAPSVHALDAASSATFDALKTWRGRQAQAAAVPPHVIFHDRVLVEVATTRPTTHAQLLAVAGIGELKVQRFGDAILTIVADHAAS